MTHQQLYLSWILSLSLVTFVCYAIDKAKARTGGQRIRERTLHLLSLLGGFPGGWMGRALFHHKTRKWTFLLLLTLSTLLHVGFYYLCYVR